MPKSNYIRETIKPSVSYGNDLKTWFCKETKSLNFQIENYPYYVVVESKDEVEKLIKHLRKCSKLM